MRSAKLDERTYLVRFQRGEELIANLTSFCAKHQIKNATLSAIGALEDPTVAHYNINTKKYSEKKLEGIFEMTGLSGNVAIFEGKPVAHCHTSLSDESMNAYGGHLIQATVSATVEMTIVIYSANFEKKMDDSVGIKVFDLPEED
jgi:predicted DNA-binding protein with PD1-like motif